MYVSFLAYLAIECGTDLGPKYTSLIDIVLGTLEGLRKLFISPDTKNANRNTSETMKVLRTAFFPFQSLSARQLAKRGENSTAFMHEMLFSVIRALGWVQAFLVVKNDGTSEF